MAPMVEALTVRMASTRATKRFLWPMDGHHPCAILRTFANKVLSTLRHRELKRLDLRVVILAHPKTSMQMDNLLKRLGRNALQSKLRKFQSTSESKLKLKRQLKPLKTPVSRLVPMLVTTRETMLPMRRQTPMRKTTRSKKRWSLRQPLLRRRTRRESKPRQPRLRILKRKFSTG